MNSGIYIYSSHLTNIEANRLYHTTVYNMTPVMGKPYYCNPFLLQHADGQLCKEFVNMIFHEHEAMTPS